MSATTRTSTIVAWVWAGLILAVGIGVVVGIFVQDILDVDSVVLITASLAYTGLGVLIAVKNPGNRIAWLFFVVATWIVISGATIAFIGEYQGPPSPVRAWDVLNIMFGNVGYFIGLLVPLILFFYLFPDGRFLTRRWSWAGWVALISSSLAVFSQVAATEVGPSQDEVDWTVSNPIGLLEGVELETGLVAGIFGIGLMAIAAGAIPALIVRYVRANATVRDQIKWVVYAAVVVGAGFVVSVVFGDAVPGWVSELGFYSLVTVFPVSVALAITRYRLYEIDRIFSRTVAYLLVVGLLGLVYLAGAVWLPSRLIGEQRPVFVAATTLAMAALFNPLRKTILTQVDRRFNRARYDSHRVLEEFTADLGNATDVDQLAQDSLELVSRTMQPASAGIWIKRDDQPDRPSPQ